MSAALINYFRNQIVAVLTMRGDFLKRFAPVLLGDGIEAQTLGDIQRVGQRFNLMQIRRRQLFNKVEDTVQIRAECIGLLFADVKPGKVRQFLYFFTVHLTCYILDLATISMP